MAKMKKVTLDDLDHLGLAAASLAQKAEDLHARASRGYLEKPINNRLERAASLQAAVALLTTMAFFLLEDELESRGRAAAGPAQSNLLLPPLRRRA